MPFAAEYIRSAMREKGSDCSHTRPGPVRVAKKIPSPAEERGLDLAHELDVVRDRGLQRDQAPGVHAERLPGAEVHRRDHPPRVHEAEAVSLQPLHDEALAPEEARPEPLLERDADRDPAGRAHERVLLADELALPSCARSMAMIRPG